MYLGYPDVENGQNDWAFFSLSDILGSLLIQEVYSQIAGGHFNIQLGYPHVIGVGTACHRIAGSKRIIPSFRMSALSTFK